MDAKNRLELFPVSFYSTVMGLAGSAIAFQKAEQYLQIPIKISEYLMWFAVAVFAAISIIYAAKLVKHFGAVVAEFNNPVRLSFFPAFSICILLFSIAFLDIHHGVSCYLWFTGTIIQFIFTLKVISDWIHHTKFEFKHMNPSWFIPAVGNIIVPVAGVSHFNHEISWFFFSIGIVFWLILMIIFFLRIIFHPEMPERLFPTFFILIPPPAVGFIAYMKMTDNLDNFARVLYYFALFILILLVFQIRRFLRIKYYLSWWAYLFPVAAITIATLLMFHKTKYVIFHYLGVGLLVSLVILLVVLTFKTVQAIMKKEICVEE